MSDCCNNNTSLPVGPRGYTGANGADGAPGADGSNGATVLYAGNISGGIVTAVATSGVGVTDLQTYSLAASSSNTTEDELASIKDTLEINASLYVVSTAIGDASIDLWMGGATLIPAAVGTFKMVAGVKNCMIRALITFQTATTVSVQFNVSLSDASGQNIGGYNIYALNVAVPSMVASSNTIVLKGQNATGVGNLVSYNMLVTKYKSI
jgi:hypothetical protein